MKNKQTAVEWLMENLHTAKDPFNQAKEMEKEQIINAFGVGCHHESKRLVGYKDVAEQYYNETYGK